MTTIDYATEDRAVRLWRMQHPWLIRAVWLGVTGFTLGVWWIAIRGVIWLALGR